MGQLVDFSLSNRLENLSQCFFLLFPMVLAVGKSQVVVCGTGIYSFPTDNALILYSFSLTNECWDNTTEYEAVIIGAELTLQSIANLTIFEDSNLILKQLRGEYNVRKMEPIPYHSRVEKLLTQFVEVK